MVKRFIDEELAQAIADMENLLMRNRIFIDRVANIGTIGKEEAIAWGLSGPCARASGCRARPAQGRALPLLPEELGRPGRRTGSTSRSSSTRTATPSPASTSAWKK